MLVGASRKRFIGELGGAHPTNERLPGTLAAHLAALEGWNSPELELDRRDVNLGYEPGNLRFITRAANRSNRRTVRELQARVSELEAHVRHLEQRAAQSIHDTDGKGAADCP